MPAPSGSLQQDKLESRIMDLLVDALNDGMSIDDIRDSANEIALCMEMETMIHNAEISEARMH